MAILATIDAAEAGRRSWDAITVGAGPAGAVAACELARRGASVLLVERAAFPRPKVCGCCLNPWSLATLAGLGLGNLVARLGGVPLRDMRLAAWGRQVVLPRTGSVSLSRQALDAALVREAVAAGAHFLPCTVARLRGHTAGGRQVSLRQEEGEVLAEARIVLAADGLAGTFCAGADDLRPVVNAQSRLGAGAHSATAPAGYESGTIFMACADGGYVGLVRLEDGTLNLAAALDPAAVRRAGGVGQAAAAVVAAAGLPPAPGIADLAWRGTPLLTRRVARAAADRVFLVGDAAGYVEPFTGEGIAWALACGAAVAGLAHRACRRWDDALAAEWSALYRRTVTRRQWACRALAWVLRYPAVMKGGVLALVCAPLLLAPLLNFLDGPTRGPGRAVGKPQRAGRWSPWR